MPRIVAVILAGGEGQRLGGVVKANIEIGGTRLLLRVTAALGACETPILVANGRLDPALLALPAGLQPAPDLDSDYRGPLAGLAGAIAWLEAERQTPDFLASVAVDTPFFPADFVSRASAMMTETNANAILARYADQDYPTNALWRFAAIRDLAERVRVGTAPHSLKRLGIELDAAHLDWPTDQAGDPFANVNTPEDLGLLEARAAQLSGTA